MMEARAAFAISDIAMKFATGEHPQDVLWNEVYQHELVEMARVHIAACSFIAFRTQLNKNKISDSLRGNLEQMMRLYAIHDVQVRNLISRITIPTFMKENTLLQDRSKR